MNRLAAAFSTALFVLDQSAAAAQEPTLATVLERAGAYVVEFQRQLSGIVAEEHYVQDVGMVLLSAGSRSMSLPAVSHRELISDFLLVRPVGADRWVEFRDVFDVDGTPVRDRDQRLTKLFLEPNRSTADQVQKIIAESTRYNIGNMLRTVNVPVLPLVFLDPVQQHRFRFRQTTDRAPLLARPARKDASDRPSRFEVPADAWVIQYDEVEKLTMIRTTNGRDLPAHGRFWIEPGTGRVLMSELVAEDMTLRGIIGVSYQSEPLVGLLVPVEMRERHLIRKDGSRIEGVATYGRFRQFQVKVDEKIAPIKP